MESKLFTRASHVRRHLIQCHVIASRYANAQAALSLIWLKHTCKGLCNQKHDLNLGRSVQVTLFLEMTSELALREVKWLLENAHVLCD